MQRDKALASVLHGVLTAALLLASPAVADVVSARPDSVAVTIYRDGNVSTSDLMDQDSSDDSGLAMITETRTVDLPAGRTKIRFEGVADGIMPQSAAVEGLPGRLVERNFDYDLMSPGALVAHSVGSRVTWVRTNPVTGKQVSEAATLRSGPDGVLLDFGGGRVEALRCGGGHERLVFETAPPGLADRPTLSALADVTTPGRYALRVSYLTVRMNWSADYIARIAPDGKTLDLTGWITLANRSAATFANAPTQVVAGKLAREDVDLPRIVTQNLATECWPQGTTHNRWYGVPPPPPPPPPPMSVPVAISAFARGAMDEMLVVTAEKRVEQSDLGDYKLYSLVEPTTVAARQTKQIMFLRQPSVTFETVYVLRIDGSTFDEDDRATGPAVTTLRFVNKPENGLGRALPAGNVAVRQPQDLAGGREVFVGEHALRDVPIGEPAELAIGNASDVQVAWRVVSVRGFKRSGRDGERAAIEATVTNAKSAPAPIEIRQPAGSEGFRVVAESQHHAIKGGDPVWRLTLPAQDQATVSYTVEYFTD